MKYGKQVFFCNACGVRLWTEMPRAIGRYWKCCSIGCHRVIELRMAESILGQDATSSEPPTDPEKTWTVIVNGTVHKYRHPSISYADVIRLASMNGNPSMMFQNAGTSGGVSGILSKYGSVVLSDRTIFNVAHTGNA